MTGCAVACPHAKHPLISDRYFDTASAEYCKPLRPASDCVPPLRPHFPRIFFHLSLWIDNLISTALRRTYQADSSRTG